MNKSSEVIDEDKSISRLDSTSSQIASFSSITKALLDRDDDVCFRDRALEEKCGVFGVISNGDWPTSLDVAYIICLGLVGLQHRGQESAGIVTCKYKNEPFNVSRSEGLVSQAFSEMSMMSLKGNLGIGHTRYSTSGGSGSIQLAQPFVVHTKYGTIAVAHNGELVNSSNLRETLLSHGVGLTTGGDSELITQCLSQTPPEEFKHPKFRKNRNKTKKNNNNNNCQHDQCNTNGDIRDDGSFNESKKKYTKREPIWMSDFNADEDNITSRLLYLMSLTPVSYSLLVMYNECLYATRDPFGNRPLSIGMLVPPPNSNDLFGGSIPWSVIDNCFIEGWCVSSESCPFPSVGAKLKRDVEPGEIIKFEKNKMPKTLAIMPRPEEAKSPSFCIFEYVYFARPDSILERQTVYTVRKRCGERLALESPAVRDDDPNRDNFIVAPVPESSIPAALGYSQKSGIPYVEVFCKNRYVGRTFIQPSTRLRKTGVAKKFGPLTENFVGKSIILIDDSIVRGTTIGHLVRLLREAGARDVHIRIASPPLHYPCYMGINIPTKDELIANILSPEQLALNLGAASLKYLSVEGLRESVQSGIREQLIADKGQVMRFGVGVGNTDMKNHVKSVNRSAKQIGAAAAALAAANTNRPQQTNSADGGGSDGSSNSSTVDGADAVGQKDLDDDDLETRIGHCDACLTGNYPVELDEDTF
jgi:amidophosphoribosyltransferase